VNLRDSESGNFFTLALRELIYDIWNYCKRSLKGDSEAKKKKKKGLANWKCRSNFQKTIILSSGDMR
jgi:hypothetical protein